MKTEITKKIDEITNEIKKIKKRNRIKWFFRDLLERLKIIFFDTRNENQKIYDKFSKAKNDQDRFKIIKPLADKIYKNLYNFPLMKCFDYTSILQGQIFSQEKDLNETSLAIDEDGINIKEYLKGSRLFPMEFWITHNYQITMSEIAKRQFDIITRLDDTCGNDFRNDFKSSALKLWDYAVTLNNNIVDRDISKIEDNFFNIISEKIKNIPNFKYGNFVMSPSTKITLIDYLNKFKEDNFVQEILNNNRLLGQDLILDEFIPEGTIYFSSSEPKSKIGFATRIELIMLPADQFVNGKLSYGFLFGQMVSFYLIDTTKVIRFKI